MQNQDTHSKVIGYLLWIFGFMGAHRFYYGRQITGTIWFFTLGLFFIGWIIDLFLIPGLVRERNVETLRLMGYDTEDEAAHPREARPLPKPAMTEADRRREEMLEDLRQTGYRKERRDINPLYR